VVSGEAHASRSYRARVEGYYVVQPVTGIAVAGPYADHADAQIEATARNRRWPSPLDPLEVRVVTEAAHAR
jgi:hypothetical protein